jgi:hypothetical protein
MPRRRAPQAVVLAASNIHRLHTDQPVPSGATEFNNWVRRAYSAYRAMFHALLLQQGRNRVRGDCSGRRLPKFGRHLTAAWGNSRIRHSTIVIEERWGSRRGHRLIALTFSRHLCPASSSRQYLLACFAHELVHLARRLLDGDRECWQHCPNSRPPVEDANFRRWTEQLEAAMPWHVPIIGRH